MSIRFSVFTAASGAYITDLRADNILASSQKKDLTIRCFSAPIVPVTTGFVIDFTKASNRQRIADSVDAIAGYLENASFENDYLIIGFGKTPFVLLEPTKNRNEISAALAKAVEIKPDGREKLSHAIEFAVDRLSGSGRSNTAFVAFSEGDDSESSKESIEKLRKRIRAEGIRLFVYTQLNEHRQVSLHLPRTLGAVVADAGGAIYLPNDAKSNRRYLGRLAQRFQNEYIIGFDPGKPEGKAKDLSLGLRLSRPIEQVSIKGPYKFYY